MADLLRLDKYLGDMSYGTRSQIRELAKCGRITVNGKICKKADTKISITSDQVFVDLMRVSYTGVEYYMLNKPKGVVSATQDKLHKTVLDLLEDKKRKDLFPVGRLDIDTEGLLLITNDGDLAHRLLSPKKHVDKIYYAQLTGTLQEEAIERIREGIILKDQTQTLPGDLEILDQTKDGASIRLRIHEGKFHQVKRMFEALNTEVIYLKREAMGTLALDPQLKPGEYRPLTTLEIEQLKGNHTDVTR